ncbi:Trk system potassium transporter TrkA, partial [Saprospiraceae bacterium]|nr:Trk system potassium transporter TrkA [Saprospiraceae bacterium]
GSTNLLLAIMAKQRGAKRTIARVNNPEYFEQHQKENFKKLGVDVLISPQLLAAQEIERLLQRGSFTDIFEFEKGRISIVGFTLDTTCPLINKTIGEIDQSNDFTFRGIALLRGHKTIIPRSSTKLIKGDHLYIASVAKSMDAILQFVGKQLQPIRKVMIAGGTSLAFRTAELVQDKYSVSVIVKNKNRAKLFAENLNNALVINADPSNVDILKEEGLEQMDAFIALTVNDETNIVTSLMAEHMNVYKTIALVDNVNYTHISQNIGVDTIINKKLIAANNIFRFVRKGKVEAIASLHGVEAEVIEFEIHKKNRLLRNCISDLRLPIHSIIAGVIRGDDSFIPSGDFLFEINDKVIVFALPEAIHQVEEIFK